MDQPPVTPSTPDTTVRDQLALDRTRLANERTFLAYVRTALTFLVAGLSFIHFFGDRLVVAIGWGFLPIGIVTFLIGVGSFARLRRRMRSEWYQR